MIFERMVFGMAKNLNIFSGFYFVESSNGTFGTNGKEKKPLFFGFDLISDLMRNNARSTRRRCACDC